MPRWWWRGSGTRMYEGHRSCSPSHSPAFLIVLFHSQQTLNAALVHKWSRKQSSRASGGRNGLVDVLAVPEATLIG